MLDPNLPIHRFPHACPCCGFATLDARHEYDICTVCWWEDDGQDNHDANVVRGGPNSNLSLSRARINFLKTGIFQPSRTDLRDMQLATDALVQQRIFTYDETTAIVAEPALGWSTSALALDDDHRQSLYNVGDHVRVVITYFNKTPHSGTINDVTWHQKLGIWHYQIVDDAGRKVSQSYAAPDFVAGSNGVR